MDELQTFLDRRAPGRNEFSTQRKEPDVPVIRSGDPLTLVIENKDQHPGDYKKLASVPRPGHAWNNPAA